MTITVTGANDVPTVDDVSVLVYGDETLTILPQDVASKFSDVDEDDPVMLMIVDLPQHGTLLMKLVVTPTRNLLWRMSGLRRRRSRA